MSVPSFKFKQFRLYPLVSSQDICWLAGFLEGEGCFLFRRKEHSPVVQVTTTDLDVAQRAASLAPVSVTGPHQSKKYPQGKPYWRVYWCGAPAAGLMMTVYSLMGERRQKKIREVLARWKEVPGQPTKVWQNAERRLAARTEAAA